MKNGTLEAKHEIYSQETRYWMQENRMIRNN